MYTPAPLLSVLSIALCFSSCTEHRSPDIPTQPTADTTAHPSAHPDDIAQPNTAATAEQISTYIRCVFQDRDGNLWFGTTSDGVVRYDGRSLQYFTTADGLSGNWVNAMVQDADGDIWFATGGGVSRYDGARFTRYTTANGLPSDQVWCLLLDRSGSLWVGTEEGAAHFDGNTFTSLSIPAADLSKFPYYKYPKQINAIVQDKEGNIWFASNGGGAYRFDPSASLDAAGTGLTDLSEKDGLSNNFVQSIMEDRDGKLWFGTRYGGVSIYDPSASLRPIKKAFTTYTREELHGDNVGLLYQDPAGTIWVGVSAIGLCSYDGKSFTRYTEKDGPGIRVVMSMLEDANGQLWLGTGAGVYRFDAGRFSNFTKADALNGR